MKAPKFNLLNYAKLATIFLIGSKSTQAQIIYTDIDPDIILDIDGEVAGVDMDNNESIDFAFKYTFFEIYSTWYSETNSYRRILCGWYNTPLNEIAGTAKYISTAYAHFYSYFPYAIQINDTVEADLPFQNWGKQRMAYYEEIATFLGFAHPDGGKWYPEKEDHYLGVRFVDDSLKNHYGWIRCSVLDSGKVLVIKDYAYEAKANHSIITGQTEYSTDIISNENNLDINVYTFHKNLYVYCKEKDFLPAQLSLYSITGEKVFSENVIQENTIVDLKDFNPGIYLVEIVSEKEQVVKKVWVQ